MFLISVLDGGRTKIPSPGDPKGKGSDAFSLLLAQGDSITTGSKAKTQARAGVMAVPGHLPVGVSSPVTTSPARPVDVYQAHTVSPTRGGWSAASALVTSAPAPVPAETSPLVATRTTAEFVSLEPPVLPVHGGTPEGGAIRPKAVAKRATTIRPVSGNFGVPTTGTDHVSVATTDPRPETAKSTRSAPVPTRSEPLHVRPGSEVHTGTGGAPVSPATSRSQDLPPVASVRGPARRTAKAGSATPDSPAGGPGYVATPVPSAAAPPVPLAASPAGPVTTPGPAVPVVGRSPVLPVATHATVLMPGGPVRLGVAGTAIRVVAPQGVSPQAEGIPAAMTAVGFTRTELRLGGGEPSGGGGDYGGDNARQQQQRDAQRDN